MNSGLIVLLALAVVTVLLPIVGIGPIVVRGERSNNNLLFVTMRESGWYIARGQVYRAVLAQEIAEWWLRWAVAMVLVAPLTLVDFGHGLSGATGVDADALKAAWVAVSALGATSWAFFAYGQLDLIGRAVEVLAADRPGYLEKEALRMKGGTRKTFADVPVDRLTRMIAARFWIARVLLALLKRRMGRA